MDGKQWRPRLGGKVTKDILEGAIWDAIDELRNKIDRIASNQSHINLLKAIYRDVSTHESVIFSLMMSLDDLDLSIRAMKCLKNIERPVTAAQLVLYQFSDLLRVRNLGKKTVVEIQEALKKVGLNLGFEPKGLAELLKVPEDMINLDEIDKCVAHAVQRIKEAKGEALVH